MVDAIDADPNEVRRSALGALNQACDRDPDDIKIADKIPEDVTLPPTGSFGHSNYCYCCGRDAHGIVAFGKDTFAACKGCRAWIHMVWARTAAIAVDFANQRELWGK